MAMTGHYGPWESTLVRYRLHPLSSRKISSQLGYRDVVAPAQALADAVDWLVMNRPEPGGEIERQLGDSFAYAAEDAMLKACEESYEAANAVEFPVMQLGHMYRHPKTPGEAWAPPSRS